MMNRNTILGAILILCAILIKSYVPKRLTVRLHRATGAGTFECWDVLRRLPMKQRKNYVLAYEAKENLEGEWTEWQDPIEFDPRYKEILAQADEETISLLIAEGRIREEKRIIDGKEETVPISTGLGTCHSFWYIKKRILKKHFGLKWKTPAEMNSHIKYD